MKSRDGKPMWPQFYGQSNQVRPRKVPRAMDGLEAIWISHFRYNAWWIRRKTEQLLSDPGMRGGCYETLEAPDHQASFFPFALGGNIKKKPR